jgi:hypothetical protein
MIRPLVAASVVLLVIAGILECTGNPSYPVTVSVAQYCGTLVSYVSACGVTDPCTVALSGKECATFASGYSDAAIGALATCLDGITCDETPGSLAQANCTEYWLATLTPTDAQAKLAKDYCAVCASTGQTLAECESAFYATIDDAGEEAGVLVIPGAAFPLIARTDSVAARADTACVPDAAVDGGAPGCQTFAACALQIIQANIPTPPPTCLVDASVALDAGAD